MDERYESLEEKVQALFFHHPEQVALECLPEQREALLSHDRKRIGKLFRPHWQPVLEGFGKLPTGAGEEEVVFSEDVVQIGLAGQRSATEVALMRELALYLKPWRKGPYALYGMEIDAEWRSHMKWDRVRPMISSLQGKKILDVGCSSGYYMFRMLAENPAWVVGVEPSEKFFMAFQLFQRFLRDPRVHFLMSKLEETDWFAGTFDTVFCLGILYHQKSPRAMFDRLMALAKPGGEVVIETYVYPGSGSLAFCPPGRYAKARNVYFIPTRDCLVAWMKQAGFTQVHLGESVQTTPEEQRRTPWMTFESLADFLHPEDSNVTIEGHPAPRRVIAVGIKPKKG